MDVRVVEVGPRDGLQNEKLTVPEDVKLRFIARLAAAGLSEIEATSFVSPKWVPQLADADAIWPKLPPGPLYSALVPNRRGLDRALALDVRRIALFTAASDTFCRKNINVSRDESLHEFREIVSLLRERAGKYWVRCYISTAFECPYEGRISPDQVLPVVETLLDIGVDEICLGDTIGVASPTEVKSLTRALAELVPPEQLAYHFHDTRGTALSNVWTALEMGVRCFDASAGGLGGCPYAPGAGGNLATEDLVYLLEREGVESPLDLRALAEASLEVLELLGRAPSARAQLAQLSRASGSPCAS